MLKPLFYFSGLILVAALMLECVARVAAHQQPTLVKTNGNPYRPGTQKYEFEESNRMQWQPFTYWRRAPYQGRHIKIDSRGLRQSDNPSIETERPLEIALFGGSVMWGTGASDDKNIPSALARQLYQAGYRDFRVTNYGESGYVSTQNLLSLLFELRDQRKPDIVLFYSGVCDIAATYSNGVAGLPHSEFKREEEYNSKKRFRELLGKTSFAEYLRSHSTLYQIFSKEIQSLIAKPTSTVTPTENKPTASVSSLAKATVEKYLSNLKLVEALSKQHQFETYFFWQPNVFTRRNPNAGEIKIKHRSPALEHGPLIKETYALVRQATDLPRNFHNVETLFDDIPSETRIFLDWIHMKEEWNAKVAHRFFAVLDKHSNALSQRMEKAFN